MYFEVLRGGEYQGVQGSGIEKNGRYQYLWLNFAVLTLGGGELSLRIDARDPLAQPGDSIKLRSLIKIDNIKARGLYMVHFGPGVSGDGIANLHTLPIVPPPEWVAWVIPSDKESTWHYRLFGHYF